MSDSSLQVCLQDQVCKYVVVVAWDMKVKTVHSCFGSFSSFIVSWWCHWPDDGTAVRGLLFPPFSCFQLTWSEQGILKGSNVPQVGVYLSFHVSVSSNSEYGCQGFGSVRRLHPLSSVKEWCGLCFTPWLWAPIWRKWRMCPNPLVLDGRSKGSLGQWTNQTFLHHQGVPQMLFCRRNWSVAGRKDFSRKQHKLCILAGRFLENGFVQWWRNTSILLGLNYWKSGNMIAVKQILNFLILLPPYCIVDTELCDVSDSLTHTTDCLHWPVRLKSV